MCTAGAGIFAGGAMAGGASVMGGSYHSNTDVSSDTELTANGRPITQECWRGWRPAGKAEYPLSLTPLPSTEEAMANLTKEDAEAVTQSIIDDTVRAMRRNAELGIYLLRIDPARGIMGGSFENRSIRNFDFNKYLRQQIGGPPEGMIDPHAHHILFKEGNRAAQKALVREGQALLRRYGIDPIFGLENLVWAPNRITGQHDIRALRNVVDQLKAVAEIGGTPEFIREILIDTLKDLGDLAAKRS